MLQLERFTPLQLHGSSHTPSAQVVPHPLNVPPSAWHTTSALMEHESPWQHAPLQQAFATHVDSEQLETPPPAAHVEIRTSLSQVYTSPLTVQHRQQQQGFCPATAIGISPKLESGGSPGGRGAGSRPTAK
jgi:hypothetical protein